MPADDLAPDAAPYVLSTLVMPAHTNHHGVLHGGHMLSWMDMAAWVVAARAVVGDQKIMFKAVNDCVWSASLHAGEVCTVTARLARVGTTSLTVELDAVGEDPVQKRTWPVCRALFTMVAVGADNHSEPIRRSSLDR